MVAAASAPAAFVQGNLIDLDADSIEQSVKMLLEHVVGLGASDLFLCTNEQHVLVQARHLGMIRPISVLSPELGKRLLTLIKTRALLDLAERRRPQEGRWIHQGERGTIDLRVSAIPTAFGEDLAIRMLDRTVRQLSLDDLGLTRPQRLTLAGALDSPGGLVLFTGPTGSGKTATLYACISRILQEGGKKKINTIEDPIEYTLEGVRQSQVHPAIGLGFSELLRSVMRQSPDIIMIGEIRDPETAAIAIRAANSGHLVLATIHATDAAAAVQSMRALGVHSHFLATALRCVVAQRLVRTLCGKCKKSFDLADAPHTFDEVAHLLGSGEARLLWSAQGCGACGMSGYDRRTGVYEVMPISRDIRHLISETRTVRDIRAQAAAEGMLEFRQSALLKVARGMTSTEEVFRSIPAEHLVRDE